MTVIASSTTADPTGPTRGAQESSQTTFPRSSNDAAAPGEVAAKSDGPATTIDISPEAQARLERLEREHAVAQKLIQTLTSTAGDGSEVQIRKEEPDYTHRVFETNFRGSTSLEEPVADPLSLVRSAAESGFDGVDFDALVDQYTEMRDRAERGEPNGFVTEASSREESLLNGVVRKLASKVDLLERSGQTEKAQQLRDAVVNGTLRVEDSLSQPDLNLSYPYTQTQFGDAGKAGKYDLTLNPTGEDKKAVAAGLAFAAGFGDNGALFFSAA